MSKLSRRSFLGISAGAAAAPFVPASLAAASAPTWLWIVGDPEGDSFFLIEAATELGALHSWSRSCRVDFTKLPADLTAFVRPVMRLEEPRIFA